MGPSVGNTRTLGAKGVARDEEGVVDWGGKTRMIWGWQANIRPKFGLGHGSEKNVCPRGTVDMPAGPRRGHLPHGVVQLRSQSNGRPPAATHMDNGGSGISTSATRQSIVSNALRQIRWRWQLQLIGVTGGAENGTTWGANAQSFPRPEALSSTRHIWGYAGDKEYRKLSVQRVQIVDE
ncbi:uncharacterized protein LY79DRAFT_584735 [Colletotrichum navitas]|uniref:Uncharacterized protein n=1 Tax=Colletotrichum navitas TaxID=681940 RepID=A0AAD8PLD8_9PEZI|nr:uncharacterized protein LY79DRAFT_584735 [Colletotrichum navitas]KAK1569409.1 hypothetical protein LY79DRAFT_584735 [Colletotrichum navitas]